MLVLTTTFYQKYAILFVMKCCFIILLLLSLKMAVYADTNFNVMDNLNNNDLIIEMSAIVDKSGNIDSSIDSVIRSYKYKSKNVSIVSFEAIDSNKEDMIKTRFLVSNFYYNKHAAKKISSSKKKSDFYAQSDKMIMLLDNAKIKYTQVLNDTDMAQNVGDENLLKLKNKNDMTLLVSDNIKELVGVKINKDDVVVIDGDTIDYHNVRYRFLGIDAAEMEQSPHGSIASNFVYQKIKNANEVYINVCSHDIYNRVLAHVFIDRISIQNSLSIMLLTNRLAIQTVTNYGDNGFEEVSQFIIDYSKNNRKRLPFTSPSNFRKKNRK